MSWRPGDGAPTFQYAIQTREGEQVVDSRTVAGTDTVVTGLVPGHTYDFKHRPSLATSYGQTIGSS